MRLSFATGIAGITGILLSALGACAAEATYNEVSVDQLNRAVPAAATPGRCESVATPDECATNARAAAAITTAIQKYGVKQRGEVVALVALMAFESNSWQYNINHYPGRPGQGTRAMLMYPYVYPYAQSLHSENMPIAAASTNNTEVMNQVRGLVLNDGDSFGSAFWYLVTAQPSYHANANRLRDGSLDDFKDYVLNGVGGDWSPARESMWNAVNQGL